ncbi:glycoside-pentoside-hexuronide (GPH):cation symporter [Oceanobacillus halophilus]|uniref:MFS transporter n=1 Tax=Oceanobacillus halophilus TaxID=930130 RepID=A0A495A2L0_9BACI|nr:glycoside-pentoside-hexuronide (GPH):cation symporter [Oceanobacillus halophilus]RKQ32283.1 MFS transporter [Oceanobacillus halophilus]
MENLKEEYVEKAVTTEKLSMKEKLSYGLGDTANNLAFSMVSTYLLVFYTDVFGIAAAVVATLFLVARILDAFTDTMMGVIIDRFGGNNPNGRFRPYLKWAGIPLVVMSVLLFLSPDLSDGGKIVYAYVTYILFGMAYTVINIPYGSMASVMTRDSGDRAALSSFRGLGSMVGIFFVGVGVVPLVNLFSSPQIGYPAVVAMMGVIALIFYYITYRNTKERIKPVASAKPEKINMQMITRIIKNGPFLALCGMTFFVLSAMLINQSVGMYYFKYVLDNEMLFPVFNALNIGATVVIVMLLPKLSKKFGKKNVSLFGFALATVAFALLFVVPISEMTVLPLLVLGMMGITIPNMLMWAFISDVIDYGEWKSGIRQEGTTYSLYSFLRKVSQAIAGFVGAMGLTIIGYVPNAVQTADTILGLEVLMVLLPAIACVVSFIIFKFGYTLSDEKLEEIAADLDAKQS